MTTGVYVIKNTGNGKVYVGSAAKSLESRIHSHKKYLRLRTHSNLYLQNAWNKWGSDSFVFYVLEVCPSEHCLIREQYWIDLYKSAEPSRGYNRRPIADSNMGLTFGEVTRAKLSAVKRGVPKSEEHKLKISNALRGKPKSKEAVSKTAAALRGRRLTELHKSNIARASKEVQSSAEYRSKMSDSVILAHKRRRVLKLLFS